MPSSEGPIPVQDASAVASDRQTEVTVSPDEWCQATPDDVPALANVFTLLSDETRLRIVFELVVRRTECPADPTLSFSTLRSRVGARDAGRFNYHLRRLQDGLVEKVDGGYCLTTTGQAVGATLVAGALGRLDAGDATST